MPKQIGFTLWSSFVRWDSEDVYWCSQLAPKCSGTITTRPVGRVGLLRSMSSFRWASTSQNISDFPPVLPHTSRLTCYVFCTCMLTQQEVVTPYMWRTFTEAGSMARKAQLDRFLLQNWNSTCTRGIQVHGKGLKIGKNTPKKQLFPEMWQPK